ncbi:hypothetical protein Droror1_Dr00015427 [Drosera rotundifolia]
MDMNGKDVRIKKVGEEGGREGSVEGDDEREALLPQGRAAVAGRKGAVRENVVVAKVRRKVQWNDNVGNKLAEVLEYQPRYLNNGSIFAFPAASVICAAREFSSKSFLTSVLHPDPCSDLFDTSKETGFCLETFLDVAG